MAKLNIKTDDPVSDLMALCAKAATHGGKNIMNEKVYSLPSGLRKKLLAAAAEVSRRTCGFCRRVTDAPCGCENCGDTVCPSCIVKGPDGEDVCEACA